MVKLKRVLTARGSQKSGDNGMTSGMIKESFIRNFRNSAKEEQVEKAIKMPEIKK